MRKITWYFRGGLVLLSLMWLASNPAVPAGQPNFIAWRNVLGQYSGVLGMAVMSVAMLLAMRPTLLERPLGGLDKMYRLHKWLGIAGLSLSVSHWVIAKSPKWLSALGLLSGGRPRRAPLLLPADSLQHAFLGLRRTAESVGEWAFYLAVVLMVLALLKRLPYHRFVQLHRVLPLAYLALVFHSVILLRFDNWATPVGWLLAALMAAGTVSAVLSLLRRHGGQPETAGRISALEYQPALKVLAVDVELDQAWPGHRAGQFAFVTFHPGEGAHPFTLASAWLGDGRVRLLIKALGDYTATLPDRLKTGDRVRLEGPYGCFTFDGKHRRQIWISGGIGVTPFVARMQALAGRAAGQQIDFFHTTRDYDAGVMQQLVQDAAAAGVDLRLLWEQRDGRLDARQLTRAVPDWRHADIWFCGPAGFGRQLRDELLALGLSPARFHQELFLMR
ncbi:ferric reductase-like transmembrane domain-containing protein [Vogesella fluminis]|uniref:Ferric reductase n=1 Tax=Vogesella fluminis TaxID=1069161 RepID=A0ABQ3HDU8_9NEIS|nr:ferric reductase-like transmembrane domain-containing protein [Vogesella fluminis]GHD77183.1 ferric reductase [Vogesella fluminis]